MNAFYNEIAAYPAQWTRNLIAAGLVAPGVVDERSIAELSAEDVRGFSQAHFFAGYGTWSHALRLAGVPDDFECWTGSCPCQPFSQAGAGRGFDDERHLWPIWFELIRECRPAVVFGEEVASPAGIEWFNAVRADLENEGYAVAAADLCAASVGAPHIRQRLFFVADSTGGRWSERARWIAATSTGQETKFERPRDVDRLADDDDDEQRRSWQRLHVRSGRSLESHLEVVGNREAGWLGHSSSSSRSLGNPGAIFGTEAPSGRERIESRSVADELIAAGAAGELGHHHHHSRLEGRSECRYGADERVAGPSGLVGATRGFWGDAEWIPCRDEKWRPAKPGAFPLVDGHAGRVAVVRPGGEKHFYSRSGALKTIGNAIVPQLAATFVRAFLECQTPYV